MALRFSLALRETHRGHTLAEDEIADCTESCPVCLSAAPRRPVCRIQRNPTVDYLYCANCKACSASHMPTGEILRKFYTNFYLEDEEEKYTFHGMDRFADHVFRRFQLSNAPKHYRILEMGGGDGTLSKEIAARILQQQPSASVDISEVEYYAGEDSSENGITIQFYDDLMQVGGPFDFVIASPVLHHIPNTQDVLRRLFNMLSDGGYFYARTAYVVPLSKILRQFMDTLYPFHVHDMGCHFWNAIIDTFELNAEIIASRPAIVTTQIRRAPFQTTAAFLMKFPAHLELFLSRQANQNPHWTFVGGWEIFLKFGNLMVENRSLRGHG